MKDLNVKGVVGGVKTFFVEMPKKRRNTIVGVIITAVVVAAVAALALNISAGQYKVLYSGLEQSEASRVYQILSEKGVSVQMSGGALKVPADQYDVLLLELAGQGYPQTALSYDVFSSHTGLTATESERKQYLIYQLQDRLQQTLERIQGVRGATVTINIPDTSTYVWQQAEEKEHAQASVLLSLDAGQDLTPSQVDGVKMLVATGCPSMEAKDVAVVNAATSLELRGTEAGSDGSALGFSSAQSMELEQLEQKRLENNIVRLLEPRYGTNGVVATARVTLNFDKMITEQKELQERPGGGGNVTHTEGQESVNGETELAGGIPGEGDNTDIPVYGYNQGNADGDQTNRTWKIDYDYSYIKTQIETGNAKLERATISVLVNEPNMSQQRRAELVDLISKGADIPVEQISVASFTAPEPEENPIDPVTPERDILTFITTLPWWVWLALGVALMLIVFVIVLIVIMRRATKKRELAGRARQEQEAIEKVRNELDEYKKQLSDAARGNTSEIDNAIMDEVKGFAKQNPEVTANLLRSWLKE